MNLKRAFEKADALPVRKWLPYGFAAAPILAVLLLFAVAAAALAQGSPATGHSMTPGHTDATTNAQAKARARKKSDYGVSLAPADERGRYTYLIEFAEAGLLQRQERAPGERFDPTTPQAAEDRAALMAEQAAHIETMTAELGRAPEVTHHYLATHSGLAANLTPAEAKAVEALPGVESVERERLYELHTYRGPTFIGADAIWDGSAVPDGVGTRGEDMVIAVLDTGVDPAHPSFANDTACGHGDGGAPDKLISFLDCSSTDGSGLCNGPAPEDSNGHGSHTASTAGGNTLDNTASPPPEPPDPFTEISGVAPCAHVRSYKVCATNNCSGAAIQAGMDSVLLHGDVDVMNFSISGGTSPWTDADRRKLDLVDAGVFVAASAGNTSDTVPDPVGQVNHRGPWVTTVAASTRDGNFPGLLSASGPGTPPGTTQDIDATKGSDSPAATALTDHPIRHFADQDPGEEGCNSATPQFPAGFFDGAVALIHRGSCAFTEKITNAFNAGADMVVIRNNVPDPIVMSTPGQPDVPAYSIEQAPGDALVAFVDANPTSATVDFELVEGGDELAGFSFRGPTPAPLEDLTKPDITAPGVSIFAAVPGGYGNISGTSMSSPHVAGAAALVRAVQPRWTVPEVKSAMMMTGFKGGTKEDGSTPWDADDVGNGRSDLTKAALAGLVMDETMADFLAADPGSGGDVKTLNLPAMRNMDCTPDCTWTRTVRNTLDVATTWNAGGASITPGFDITVTPADFSFTGDTNETQELTITATPTTDLTGSVAFGEVVLTEAGALSPDLHMTVSIQGEFVGPAPEADIAPASFDFAIPVNDTDSDTLNVGNIGDEDLVWNIDTAAPAGPVGIRDHDPGLDEAFDLADFDLDSPANGGTPEVFSVPAGVATEGDVVGFSFSGTVAGISGSDSWASDTCLIVEAPDGTSYGVGGFSGTEPQCNVNAWDFDGSGSSEDGTYASTHDGVFPAVPDAGNWTFTFINDWDSVEAATMSWSDVTVTLHKTEPWYCDDISAVSWLSATPDNGTTVPSDSVPVTVTVDSSIQVEGIYDAALCVTTNDPDPNRALVQVPVTLTVGNPAPVLAFDPVSLDFGDVNVGETSAPMTALLQNTGNAPASGLAFTGPGGDFTADTSACGASLAVGADCQVSVTFSPTTDGAANGTLQATTTEGVTADLALAGNGIAQPALSFDPSSLDFGDVEQGTTGGPMTALLQNTGGAEATGLAFTDPGGDFTADTSACGATLAAGADCQVSITFSPTALGAASDTLQADSTEGASAVLDLAGNGVPETGVFAAQALSVDAAPLSSDGNGVFEPGETVAMAPTWENGGGFPQTLTGTASGFTGPGGATYTLVETAADYGEVPAGSDGSCEATGSCYELSVDDPATRPATHWDATVDEALSDGGARTWTLHIGDSFTDVPRSSGFYPWIETVLHEGVTAGCGPETYCPSEATQRNQMAVFVLKALEGEGYTPPACTDGSEVFGDVPFDNPFCGWIEELADRGVVAGCGGGNYCPNDPVSRDQMAVFLLVTLEGDSYTPPACTGDFGDVACPSPFADWIEELAARGITAGCGGGNYCPGDPVTRDQMAVFLGATFGLEMYAP